jgi:hypothetical protein
VLVGCTPSQRIARIAEKYNLKQYEEIIFRDTIIVEEKIYLFDTKIDSVGNFHQQYNDSEVFGYIHDSIVHIELITKADTVYIEKAVEIETIKVEKIEKTKIPLWFLLFFGCTVICFWLFWIYRDKKGE